MSPDGRVMSWCELETIFGNCCCFVVKSERTTTVKNTTWNEMKILNFKQLDESKEKLDLERRKIYKIWQSIIFSYVCFLLWNVYLLDISYLWFDILMHDIFTNMCVTTIQNDTKLTLNTCPGFHHSVHPWRCYHTIFVTQTFAI